MTILYHRDRCSRNRECCVQEALAEAGRARSGHPLPPVCPPATLPVISTPKGSTYPDPSQLQPNTWLVGKSKVESVKFPCPTPCHCSFSLAVPWTTLPDSARGRGKQSEAIRQGQAGWYSEDRRGSLRHQHNPWLRLPEPLQVRERRACGAEQAGRPIPTCLDPS